MNTPQQLALHLRQVYFGGNWTWSNLRDNIKEVSLKQATQKFENLNTIATLTFHIHYFVKVQLKLLKEGVLEGKDAESFDHPKFENEQDWIAYKNEIFKEAEEYIELLSDFDEKQIFNVLIEEKYGSYFRNFLGLIEHTHYHLGQIALVKKLTTNEP
ncbi:MAG: DUF1572 domain-containing protein [Bacteroidia bacterium]